jgi:hypothetical protein
MVVTSARPVIAEAVSTGSFRSSTPIDKWKTRLLLPWQLPFPAALTADVIAKADLAEQPFANGTGSHPHSFFTFAEGRAKSVSS